MNFGVLSRGNSLRHIQEAQELAMRSDYISVALILRVRSSVFKGRIPMCLLVGVRIKMKKTWGLETDGSRNMTGNKENCWL